jgi:L-alanine-DL-glutamate epimerase-like enolase superfamily enzyme
VHFQKDPLLTTDGVLQLQKPGFGIELDESKIKRKEVVVA